MQNRWFNRWFNGWKTSELIDDLMAEKWMEINAKNHWFWAQNWMQLNEPRLLIRCKNPEISNDISKLRRFLNWKREPCSSIVIPEMIFFGGKRLPCHTWNDIFWWKKATLSYMKCKKMYLWQKTLML